jgi:hypothetical protein
MPAFLTEIDIMNRACQLLRRPGLTRRTMQSSEAVEMDRAYDQRREAELGTNLWRFATRRVVLRAISTATDLWTPAAYSAATTYAVGNIVTYDSQWWQSKVASNLANTPAMGAYWRRYTGVDYLNAYDEDLSYFAGEIGSSGGLFYLSLINANEDNDPPSAGNWLLLGGTAVDLQILYPLGTGPAADTTTSNVYRLPRGFLRTAPTNPKGASSVWMGMPRGTIREDWVFEDNYIVSGQTPTLLLRYVADMIDVPDMPALFCELLAASCAEATASALVQPQEDVQRAVQRARATYRKARSDAVRVNAIEVGPIDPYIDDLILCRL